MDTPDTKDIKELGANCLNQAIKAKKDLGQRFRWRDLESISLLINNVNTLNVSDTVKQRIFDNFLPEFSDTVEPMYESVNSAEFGKKNESSN